MVGLPTALYYCGVFVHRLGATTTDRGFLLLVDGQVMTAFGIFIQDFLQFRVQYLPEMFGIHLVEQTLLPARKTLHAAFDLGRNEKAPV